MQKCQVDARILNKSNELAEDLTHCRRVQNKVRFEHTSEVQRHVEPCMLLL